MYVTGDTLLHDGLAEIAGRYPDIDVCLIHLGGTRIAGVLLTMDGAQGARAPELIRPRTALPVHYEDYTVFKSPLRDFLRALEETDIADRVHIVPRGNEFRSSVPPIVRRSVNAKPADANLPGSGDSPPAPSACAVLCGGGSGFVHRESVPVRPDSRA
jgi:hypothetical protein